MEPGNAEPGSSAQPSKPTCCLGALYFSQSRYERQLSPVCAGFSKRLRPSGEAGQLPQDSIPGGEFKYVCLGYSAWDDEGLKRAARRRNSSTDAVQLPYCEGLEVVSAAAVQGRPELLTGGPELGGSSRGAAPPSSSSDPGPAGTRQRPGRTFVPGAAGRPQMPEPIDWTRFQERFERIARRMVDKMAANAAFMATTAKRTWQQIAKEVRGGGGGSGGGGGGT